MKTALNVQYEILGKKAKRCMSKNSELTNSVTNQWEHAKVHKRVNRQMISLLIEQGAIQQYLQ